MCREEFSISQVKLHHLNASDFVTSPWFAAVIVTIYRFIFAGYCLGWIIYSGFHHANGEEKWFIYLTNWAFAFVTLYFIMATTISLVHHFKVTRRSDHVFHMRDSTARKSDAEDGGDAAISGEPMAWYHKTVWVIYNIAANIAVLVTLMYWTVIFGGKSSGLNVSNHLLNSIFILGDLVLSSVPIRLLHAIYPWIFSLCYALFTVIFWAADGTNARGEPYIYSVVDFTKSPGLSSGILICLTMIGIPLSQASLFGLFKLRVSLNSKCGNSA